MGRNDGVPSDDFWNFSSTDSDFDLSGFDDSPEPEEPRGRKKKKRGRKGKRKRVQEPTFDDGFGFGSVEPSADFPVFDEGEDDEPEPPRRKRKGRKQKPAKKKRSRKRDVAPAPEPELDDLSDDDVDMDVDDDEFFEESPKRSKSVGKSVVAPIVSLVTVVVLVIVGVVVFALKSDSGSAPEAKESTSSVSTESTSSAVEEPVETTPALPEATTSERVGVEQTDGTLNGESSGGDQTSGTDAIFAYEYAYYHLRSDEEANALSDGIPAVDIKDKVAEGTKYEVKVTPKVIGSTYDVVLTLSVDGNSKYYKMSLTTSVKDGKYYVTSIKMKE